MALQKAQATQVYAGLGLWDTATVARLVQSQLVEDGVYPGAAEVFSAGEPAPTLDYRPDQPRDPQGRWTEVGGGSGQENDPPDPSAYEAIAPEKIFHQFDLPADGDEIRLALTQGAGVGSGAGGDLRRPGTAQIGQSPDGEPIEAAEFRGKRGLGTAIATLLGAVARLLRRWRAWEPDDPDPTPPVHTTVDPSSQSAPSSLPAESDDNGRVEPSPPGLVITVRGSSTTARGDSYSDQIREYFGGVEAPQSNVPGASVPDGLFLVDDPDGPRAMEAKYVGDWPTSPYRPGQIKPYPTKANVDKIVEQAVKYDLKYDQVRWITNSPEFAAEYTDRFRTAGVRRFTFMLIPAVKERR